MLGTQVVPPRYAGVRLEARGGMGDVYVAHDQELRRLVAIKLLHPLAAEDEAARARFAREARAAAQLSSHPHVVTIYDVGEWRGQPFIVMEHLTGGTLAQAAAAGPLPTPQALRYLADAAEALDEAHRRGIVHRDVKPGNLILDARGRVRVADFGIARIAGSGQTMTAAGTVLGSAGYLAPEQARGEPATGASDVYALGVVAFELLTGGRPFARANETAEALAHVQEPPPRASQAGPWLPRDVDPVFERVLAKRADARYPSAGAFVTALTRALATRAAATTRALPVVQPPPRRRRFHGATVLGLLALLAAAGVAVAAVVEARVDQTVLVQRSALQDIRLSTGPPAGLPAPSPPPAPPAPPADGHALNDQGYALLRDHRTAAAVPLLGRAVAALRGRGPADPYEAYANYNLGVALVESRRCAEAVAPLRLAQRLEGGGKVGRVLRLAERCA